MAIGKLYDAGSGDFLAEVDYRLLSQAPNHWWGELTIDSERVFRDGDSYLIQLDDGRKGRCFLHRRVNKAVAGFLTRYHYRFTGSGKLS